MGYLDSLSPNSTFVINSIDLLSSVTGSKKIIVDMKIFLADVELLNIVQFLPHVGG